MQKKKKAETYNTIELLHKLNLSIPPDLVNYMAKVGKIPSFKVGSRRSYRSTDLRVIRTALKDWIKNSRKLNPE